MTTPAPFECDVPTYVHEGVLPVAHRLGGPVDVIGFDAAGHRVGVIANPITDDEIEVFDPSGQVVRLVITPAVEEGELSEEDRARGEQFWRDNPQLGITVD